MRAPSSPPRSCWPILATGAIALLNGERRLNFAADRERGFRSALATRGLMPVPET